MSLLTRYSHKYVPCNIRRPLISRLYRQESHKLTIVFMPPVLFNENYQSFLIQFDEWIDFSHTHPSLNHLIFSLNKATEYSTPCLISFFEKIETLPKFSSFPRTAHVRVATNGICFIHSKSVNSFRLEFKTKDCTPKNAFSCQSDRPKMKRHTISSVIVLKALSCHQVERLLRLHSGMPKYSGTPTQNLKLRVTCNDSLCTENKVDYSRLRDPSNNKLYDIENLVSMIDKKQPLSQNTFMK